MDIVIRVDDLHYTYGEKTDGGIEALRGVSFHIYRGEHVAVVGRNGSGKSTLAKCLNGLLIPTQGNVWAYGHNTRHRDAWLAIRSAVGMVFQNPENQFLTTSVEEEVAFGPENLGLPPGELEQRVRKSLQRVGLDVAPDRDPRHLSAGQKAKLAIAAVLAMEPQCLILDESTALLDPVAREQIMETVRQLQSEGMTIINVTHFMEEAVCADRVLVLGHGKLLAFDAPSAIFANEALCAAAGIQPPVPAQIAQWLVERGLEPFEGILTEDDLVAACLAYSEKVRC